MCQMLAHLVGCFAWGPPTEAGSLKLSGQFEWFSSNFELRNACLSRDCLSQSNGFLSFSAGNSEVPKIVSHTSGEEAEACPVQLSHEQVD